MRLSYVIISFNRKATLLSTLKLLPSRTPLDPSEYDIWVVDNGSTDGSAEAVAERFPLVKIIPLYKNEGMPARNHAFADCTGQYIICLDDDSYPKDAQSVARMIGYLDEHPNTAAVVARVELPDGTPEAPALPAVLLGGASCIRKSVIDDLGGYSPEFFRQAEEYDLSFRIWNAGWRIERFEDIVFLHEKVAGPGRASETVSWFDLRNNLIIADRFLPEWLRRVYWEDWNQRYTAIAQHNGFGRAARSARLSARVWSLRQSMHRHTHLLHLGAIESIFGIQQQAESVDRWAKLNRIKSIAIADYSKNLYATYQAAQQAGLNIVSIADDGPAFKGLTYRGISVLSVQETMKLPIDGVVMSNINPAQIDRRINAIHSQFQGPILRLWEGQTIVPTIRSVPLAA